MSADEESGGNPPWKSNYVNDIKALSDKILDNECDNECELERGHETKIGFRLQH